MDSGWAVVMGAAIGFIGSALLPWIRNEFEDRRHRAYDASARRREAVVELLAANAMLAWATISKEYEHIPAALERRYRAGASLLLELPLAERETIRRLLNGSLPLNADASNDDGAGAGRRMRALQAVLSDWATGDLAIDEVVPTYSRLSTSGVDETQTAQEPKRDHPAL